MWITFLLRDFAAILTVIAAGTTLLVAVIGLLARKRSRMRGGLIESGVLAWVGALVGCLGPYDRSVFLGKSQVIAALVVSGAGWILSFIIMSLGKSRGS